MEEFSPDLLVTYKKNLQIISFNRPEKKNAFSDKTYHGLPKALALATENTEVVMTVLTGIGDYFSSGNDLSSQLMFGNVENFEEMVASKCRVVRDFVDALIDYPKLLVAVVNGPAIGLAVTMLGLCDLVYASDTATFMTPFTLLGISAEGCSTYTFPRIMGQSLACQMLYFNHKITAIEAKQCGLVAEIYCVNTFHQLLNKLIKWAMLPKMSLFLTKSLVWERERSVLHEVNRKEVEVLEKRFKAEDCLEALLKFTSRKNQASKL